MELRQAETLAKALIIEHGIDKQGYIFQFSNGKRIFGYCNYTRRVISLSETLTLLNDETRVKDVILHEIAHAIVGSGNGHNHIWKATALKIGCNGQRCYNSEDTNTPEAKYIYQCCNCGYNFKRFRRIKGYTTAFHPACGQVKGRLKRIK